MSDFQSPAQRLCRIQQHEAGRTSHKMPSVASLLVALMTGLEARLLKMPTLSWACTDALAGSLLLASKPYLRAQPSLMALHTCAYTEAVQHASHTDGKQPSGRDPESPLDKAPISAMQMSTHAVSEHETHVEHAHLRSFP